MSTGSILLARKRSFFGIAEKLGSEPQGTLWMERSVSRLTPQSFPHLLRARREIDQGKREFEITSSSVVLSKSYG